MSAGWRSTQSFKHVSYLCGLFLRDGSLVDGFFLRDGFLPEGSWLMACFLLRDGCLPDGSGLVGCSGWVINFHFSTFLFPLYHRAKSSRESPAHLPYFRVMSKKSRKVFGTRSLPLVDAYGQGRAAASTNIYALEWPFGAATNGQGPDRGKPYPTVAPTGKSWFSFALRRGSPIRHPLLLL